MDQGCIPPLCDLLTLTDAKTVQVALNGIDNILKAGQQSDQRDNPYAVLIEECFGKYSPVGIHFSQRSVLTHSYPPFTYKLFLV